MTSKASRVILFFVASILAGLVSLPLTNYASGLIGQHNTKVFTQSDVDALSSSGFQLTISSGGDEFRLYCKDRVGCILLVKTPDGWESSASVKTLKVSKAFADKLTGTDV